MMNNNELLEYFVEKELEGSFSASTLFRNDSASTDLINLFMENTEIRQYFARVVNGVIARCKASALDTLDPQEVARDTLNTICLCHRGKDAAPLPGVITTIASTLRRIVSKKYPDHWPIAVGGFFFLRGLFPAVVSPKKVGIKLKDSSSCDANTKRQLVKVTKAMMEIVNTQITNNNIEEDSIVRFLDDISSSQATIVDVAGADSNGSNVSSVSSGSSINIGSSSSSSSSSSISNSSSSSSNRLKIHSGCKHISTIHLKQYVCDASDDDDLAVLDKIKETLYTAEKKPSIFHTINKLLHG
ncbi:hypothetical protein SAMD00019534_069410 [Acytostelium subglobosum LB1]|uniref:hypothetical protein n=1 Tax=Acytostelium subglobosum LB1 TaxID=1410327 RepID=UPI0006451A1A|nr:hypothetical protein SAMD00019534_069410 [Acytostelium subglobosum LB1]GAM23766.1 hypothetical protein SAMD00019534_069410 [Acytostelium subglobosum LB1]|eukprot:XP_012753507.1 hypothetical protein SAMD00019534_069410 [Acytostelium subglobosum LB1]